MARPIAMMEQITGEPPVLWGPSIVGFGKYRYRYESGREGEAGDRGFLAARRKNWSSICRLIRRTKMRCWIGSAGIAWANAAFT